LSAVAQHPIALGFRAGRGGSVVVGVATDQRRPMLALSSFLATAAQDDRLAFEPYHVAYEMDRGPGDGPRRPWTRSGDEVSAEAVAAVAEGRRRQAALAEEGLAALVRQLEEAGRKPAVAALLVNRAGWMTDLLGHALSAPEHPPVVEGLAVREALRFACRRCGLPFVEMDEKTLDEAAAVKLGRSSEEIESALKALGAAAGKPWRKEQKHACLAAWVAAAGR
jgi:hypothetical protein